MPRHFLKFPQSKKEPLPATSANNNLHLGKKMIQFQSAHSLLYRGSKIVLLEPRCDSLWQVNNKIQLFLGSWFISQIKINFSIFLKDYCGDLVNVLPSMDGLQSIGQWRIQDFPEVGAPTLHGGRQHMILPTFPKNCMKLKEFGPRAGRASLAPPPLRSYTVGQKETHWIFDF